MIVPEYQMLEYVEKIASTLADDPPRPLIMGNPRLYSADVGVGFNVRQLRRYFLRLWKVFNDDKDRPNRYLLAKDHMPTVLILKISRCYLTIMKNRSQMKDKVCLTKRQASSLRLTDS